MKSDPADGMTTSAWALLPPGWSESETLSTGGLAQAGVGTQEQTAAAAGGDWAKVAEEVGQ